MDFQVPASLDQAKADLNGLGALLTAKQWERAAIVYAFTEPGSGTGSNQHVRKSGHALGIREFARLGIAGLRDEETVAWVREAWQDAIEDGQASAAAPGDSVALPDRDFPKHPRTRTAYDGFRAQLRKSPDAVRELIRDEPEIAAQLARQVVDTPAARFAVEERLSQPVPRREEPDYGEPASRDHVRSSIDEAMEEWRKENAWRATMEALKYVTPLQRFSPEDVARDTPTDDWEHTKNSLERAAALLGSFAARLAERSLRRVQ